MIATQDLNDYALQVFLLFYCFIVIYNKNYNNNNKQNTPNK